MKHKIASENKIQNKKHKKYKQEKRNKRVIRYGASIFVFVALVMSALWLPQVFFDFSDTLMYGQVNLAQQEKPDVMTLTTGYEESLYDRLAGFAEGLAGQRQYYVDEQSKEVTDEIRDFLFESELRFYARGIYTDIIIGVFAEMLGFALEDFAEEAGLELKEWKQYVIYSDDYAQGVNFILWCFGLKNALGDELTILMDAHDYTIYAVQMTGGMEKAMLKVEETELKTADYSEHYESDAAKARNVSHLVDTIRMQGFAWMTLNIYYEIIDQKELEQFSTQIEEIYFKWSINQQETITSVLSDSAGNDVEIYLKSGSAEAYGKDGESWYGIEENGALYYRLPVGNEKVTFDMYNFGEVYDAGQNIYAIMGILEIYELIPEFQ